MSVGANLKRLREAADLTQEALGDVAHLKQSDISKWEKGQVPSLQTLMRLATALGVSLDALVAGVDPDYDSVVAAAAKAVVESAPPVHVGREASDVPQVTTARILGGLAGALAALRAAHESILTIGRDVGLAGALTDLLGGPAPVAGADEAVRPPDRAIGGEIPAPKRPVVRGPDRRTGKDRRRA